MISREDVVTAYRYILNREPESDEVVEYHRTHSSVAVLREAILGSEEFADAYRWMDPKPLEVTQADGFAPHQHVETGAEGSARSAMWARVAENWRKLGEEAPHWSVLTRDEFRPDALAANRDAFRETVSADMALVDAALERLPDADALRAGRCLEIGCGVGRATRGLAERFDRVLAVDVSAPHLEIAERELTDAGHGNVAFRRMETIEDYADLGAPQFLYSRIVLQHNPPPVQAAILRNVLGNLASPGAALFQIITHIAGYNFSTDHYLAQPRDGMEMHVMPQADLFAILRETGMDVVEFNRDDSAVGDLRYRSHMVLAHKL